MSKIGSAVEFVGARGEAERFNAQKKVEFLKSLAVRLLFDKQFDKLPCFKFRKRHLHGEKVAYIIAIDEGTTSTRAILYDIEQKKITGQSSSQIEQIYPKSGYVEENPNEIYAGTLAALAEMLEQADSLTEVKGIGIANQRETVFAWDRITGKPLYNAIVWQCRRTADFMKSLEKEYGDVIREETGLVCDAYFSASKMKWLMDNVPEIREKASRGELCLGTADSFLAFKLTRGKAFVTDVTNASRTMLFNIKTGKWDKKLLDIFGIPENCLPKVIMSDEYVGEFEYNGVKIPVCGMAGDQQAALIGQSCFSVGDSKITYGTGMFMLYNIGRECLISKSGLVTTVAYGINGELTYSFEGSVFNAGSAIQWLRDCLGFFGKSSESEALATSVPSTDGVYFVPAFTGLGAPYWQPCARGVITGITRATTKAHITRAALEAMAYSARDLVEVMERESGAKLKELKCDGGASSNDFLMAFQASVLGVCADRPREMESTALGAVYLCMLGLKIKTKDEIQNLRQTDKRFYPDEDKNKYNEAYNGWKKAVERSMYGC